MVITEYRDLIYHVEFRNFHSTAKNKTQELKGLQGVLSIHFPSLKRHSYSGADPGFQVRGGGAHLKKLRRAEGGAKIVGVFRVKNHVISS